MGERTAQLETAPTKQENGRCGFLTAPVWNVSLILRSTIIFFSDDKQLVRFNIYERLFCTAGPDDFHCFRFRFRT